MLALRVLGISAMRASIIVETNRCYLQQKWFEINTISVGAISVTLDFF